MSIVTLVTLVVILAVLGWLVLQFLWPRRGLKPSAENNWSQGNPDRDRSLDNDIPSPASRSHIDGGGLL